MDTDSTLEPTATISKNKERKLRNYQKRLENRPVKRKKERLAQKAKGSNTNTRRRRPHEDEKEKIQERLLEAQRYGPRVVIDCQFDTSMSDKEQRRLAQQLRRVYSSNKASLKPLHLYFTSMKESSEFFNICCKVNCGFPSYFIDRSESSFMDLFAEEQSKLVYLSPDAKNALEYFDPSRIYIIGGLVDETTRKNITHSFVESKSIQSYRLPIDEYFTQSDKGTFKSVLTVNQIIDIILKWYETKNWIEAIKVGLPQRTGFVPKCIK